MAHHHSILSFIFYTSFICILCYNYTNATESTLQLVHVFFRHGARTIDATSTYPTDPYKNETFYPYGVDELTMSGKVQMFELGKMIRKHYDIYLGKKYMPDLIEAVSSYYNRTKVSLELALAAMFPPLENEMFVPGLNWQPIPFTHIVKKTDNFFGAVLNCPNYRKEVAAYQKTPEFSKIFTPDKNIFEYVQNKTGKNIFSYYELVQVYNVLLVEQEWGLPLPKWAEPIYPKLVNLSFKCYSFLTSTRKLAKITAGYIIKRLIDDMEQKIHRASFMHNRKMILFSGHDVTIAALLGALKVFKPPLPQYGSHVFVELHKINQTYGIKLFYNPGISEKNQLLTIPNCAEFCTFNHFKLLTKELMPGPQNCGNEVNCEKSISSLVFSSLFLEIFVLTFCFLFK